MIIILKQVITDQYDLRNYMKLSQKYNTYIKFLEIPNMPPGHADPNINLKK